MHVSLSRCRLDGCSQSSSDQRVMSDVRLLMAESTGSPFAAPVLMASSLQRTREIELTPQARCNRQSLPARMASLSELRQAADVSVSLWLLDHHPIGTRVFSLCIW
jgi:hypothetical protein